VQADALKRIGCGGRGPGRMPGGSDRRDAGEITIDDNPSGLLA
jgi:hypothetical protein